MAWLQPSFSPSFCISLTHRDVAFLPGALVQGNPSKGLRVSKCSSSHMVPGESHFTRDEVQDAARWGSPGIPSGHCSLRHSLWETDLSCRSWGKCPNALRVLKCYHLAQTFCRLFQTLWPLLNFKTYRSPLLNHKWHLIHSHLLW